VGVRVNDQELKFLEMISDEIAELALPTRDDQIRRMRDQLFALKLLARVAPPPKPPIWNQPYFIPAVLMALSVIANLMGLQIPVEKIFGGK
jgi:hypothetical protein